MFSVCVTKIVFVPWSILIYKYFKFSAKMQPNKKQLFLEIEIGNLNTCYSSKMFLKKEIVKFICLVVAN